MTVSDSEIERLSDHGALYLPVLCVTLPTAGASLGQNDQAYALQFSERAWDLQTVQGDITSIGELSNGFLHWVVANRDPAHFVASSVGHL